ncbi:hypothetical protein AVEN_176490-1 [Araneus ventricosus]|uniref:Uncharacterized protein n=1 Tax=Araneus ventricosus TaxID=182803 RepID=A0A4Y2L1I7_ARAVE|nr:hypothetical protein AVEN_176490-1 [Araneus ventricosus]
MWRGELRKEPEYGGRKQGEQWEEQELKSGEEGGENRLFRRRGTDFWNYGGENQRTETWRGGEPEDCPNLEKKLEPGTMEENRRILRRKRRTTPDRRGKNGRIFKYEEKENRRTQEHRGRRGADWRHREGTRGLLKSAEGGRDRHWNLEEERTENH